MKKLFSSLLLILVLVPTFVFAEVEEKKEPIKIYEFYGSSCSFCASLNAWFASIEEDYGDYFDLVKYEVWGSEENNALMSEVAKAFGESVSGVPYLIIGDYTVNGYSEEDNEALLKNIISEYEKDIEDRDTTASDVIANFKFENNDPNMLVVGIITAIIVVGIVVIVIKAREE